VATPRLMLSRPAPNTSDDNFREDGQAASSPGNPFGTDLTYGHRNAAVGNGNRNDQYLPSRRCGAEYLGCDTPGGEGDPGTFFRSTCATARPCSRRRTGP
jgi:hypothetical protein